MAYQTREYYETQGKLLWEGKVQLDPSSDTIRSMALKMCNDLRPGVVLNIGIGPNPLVDIELFRKSFSVVGIDISYYFIISARRMLRAAGYPARLIVSEAINLPFCKETFDVCVCSEVIEHLKEPQELLKEINRVLKPHGKLILTTPNRFNLSKVIISVRRIFYERKIRNTSDTAHAKEYTPREISKIYRKFFNLRANRYIEAFPANKDAPFFKAPIGKICNALLDFPLLKKLSNTMGFVLEKI